MTTTQSPDEWWDSLEPSRKASVQRWLSARNAPVSFEIPGQTAIDDYVFFDEDIDLPIPFHPSDSTN